MFVFVDLIGQHTSYLLGGIQPEKGEKIAAIDERYFGKYVSADDKVFVFNAKGVFSQTPLVVSISKETVREDPRYSISGDYLHGVIEGDSVLFVEEEDRFYYLIEEQLPMVSENSINSLIMENNSIYWINFKEELNGFTPIQLSFKGKELVVSYFDYGTEVPALTAVEQFETKEDQGLHLVLLFPSKKEWEKIVADKTLWRKVIYYKAEEEY